VLKINCKDETLIIEIDVRTIEVEESISGSNDFEFRDFLNKHSDDGNCPRLILDFHKLRFINSSGLGAIANLSMKMRKHKGELVIVSPNKEVTQVFEVTKLDQVLNIVKDKETALRLFS